MKRFLLAGLASAALVLSPAAARPAQADGGAELLGLLLGIGTVYAIGKGIEQARMPAAAPEPVADRYVERHNLAPGYGWSRPQRTVPRDCLGSFDTWHGELRGFEAGCLARNRLRPESLPAACAIDTRIGHRDATVFPARCLQLEGWEIGHSRADWWRGPAWSGSNSPAR